MTPVERFIASLPHFSGEQVDALASELPETHVLRPTIAAILCRRRNLAGTASDDDVLSAIDRALELPTTPIEARITLLNIAARTHRDTGGGQTLQRYIDAIRELVRPDLCLPLQVIPLRLGLNKAILQRAAADGATRLAEADALLAGQEGSDLWLEFRIHRLELLHEQHHYVSIEPLFAQLRPWSDKISRQVLDRPFDDWEGLCLAGAGRVREAEAFLQPSAGRGLGWSVNPLLVLLGRYQEVARNLARMTAINENSLTGETIRLLAGEICLLQHDLDGVRTHIRLLERWSRERGAPTWTGHKLSLQLALIGRQAAQARHLLQELDPRGDYGDCHVEWARLHLLEGRADRAAAAAARAIAWAGPEYLALRLRTAHELDATQTAGLWASALAAPATAATEPSPPEAPDRSDLVGESLTRVRERIRLLAPRGETTLITGETGTGKEIAARMLHDLSPRRDQPFIALNCAGLPESLAEAELFGHERGSFTGAEQARPGACDLAGEGTLLLDEVTSLPPRLQGLLLRLLETGDYLPVGASVPRRLRARVVACTNEPVEAAVAAGRLRADLSYRLRRLTIDLPPLRERAADIPALVRHVALRFGLPRPPAIAPDLLAAWMSHPWPGNVRELRNEVESLLVLHGGESVLRLEHSGLRPAEAPGPRPAAPPALPSSRTALRRQALLDLLAGEGRLTRKRVMEVCACAANTAAAALADLERAGRIRRVVTSANLRTSYWVAADGAPSG